MECRKPACRWVSHVWSTCNDVATSVFRHVTQTARYDNTGSRLTARYRRELDAARLPSVAIATAIPPDPCAFPVADHMYVLGVSNKQDYAHAHGWELHLSAGLIDPAVTAVSAHMHAEAFYLMLPT